MMNKLMLIICFFLVISCVSTTNTKVQKSNTKMNVLFIAVDDLNHWVNYFGRNKQTKTPNLDRLSAMGMSFTNAHCAAPVCCPSRAAVMSGLRPSTSGVYGNQDDWRLGIPREITMPTFFRKNGYNVMAGGKIYHGRNYDREDEFDFYYHSPRNDFNKKLVNKGVEGAGMNWGEIDDGDEALSDYHVATWASEELSKKHDKPQFLAVGFTKPHLPWNVPKKYFDMFPVESIELPPYQEDDLNDIPKEGVRMANPDFDHTKIKSKTEWKQAIRAYLANIAYVDAQIGRVLDAYEKSPEKDNTIILLWGDHGWNLGEKHHWRKAVLWEESTRSPLIWVVPGMTKPGSKCEKTTDFMSFYPTLSELNGLEKPLHLEGLSTVSLLKNPNAEWNTPALTTMNENNHSIRSSKFRYTRYAQGGEEFYDETKDPYEWKNLIGDKTIEADKEKLSKFLPKINKKPVGNNGVKAGA